MLDHLTEELIEEERRTERRVCALLRANPKPQRQPKVKWIDTILEEVEEAEESGSDSNSDDEDDLKDHPNFRSCKAKSPPPKRMTQYFADEESDEDTMKAVNPSKAEIYNASKKASLFPNPDIVLSLASDRAAEAHQVGH